MRRALADARNLAQLQIEILDRLDQADQARDDETVLSCHAELDHVMALIAETEQMRTGARSTQAVEEAMATLGHRGKQARTEGLAALRELHETLATVSQRLRRTQAA